MTRAEPIYILAKCRNAKLVEASMLVFRTIRVGFPDAPIIVYGMAPDMGALLQIENKAREVGARWADISRLRLGHHDEWIALLLHRHHKPFWICDTDVVFWRKFEFESTHQALAGVLVPEFYEPWTQTQYRARLHTCLMRIDPQRFQANCDFYRRRCAQMPFEPRINFVHQQFQPERRGDERVDYFYDTLAMAWHAFGGQAFTQEQIESFDHLNCATYADLIGPSLDFPIEEAHRAIYEDHTCARGLWARQFEWFEQHKERQLV